MTGTLRGMADAPPANRRPRWYQDLRWILAGLMLVVVATTLYGLFGPDAPIVVSPATTLITEPLAADGLPDYAAHVLARAGRGTPPDDNAAVPLLMALWPLELDDADLPAVCQELGIDVPSPPPEAFQADALSRDTGIRAAIESILADRVPAEATSITPFDVIDAAGKHPWRAADLPALDTWLAAHAGRLDLLREASRRPRFYLPNPTLLRGNRDSVLSSGLHLGRPLRQAVTVLQLRAMGHLGHGRPTEAWRDILAMHRLARLASAADGGSVVGRLSTVVCSGAACAATLQLLDAPGLPAEVAATISQDLEALPPFPPHAQMIALDRLGSAAFVIHACTAPRGKRREHFEHVVEVMDDVFAATSLDGNVILEDVNAAYAALEQALRVPAWQDRERELVRLDAGWQAAVSGLGPAAKLADTCRLLLNRGVRSGRIARRLNAVLCPVMASADATVTRCEAFFELTRVAAALAACRAAGGAATTYPERLDDLVPRYLDRLPTDPFCGGPFVYERRGAGYLLSSIGPNGRDDGGTDYSTPIVAGEWMEKSPHLGDAKTTDVVVRLPLPGSPILERLRARP